MKVLQCALLLVLALSISASPKGERERLIKAAKQAAEYVISSLH